MENPNLPSQVPMQFGTALWFTEMVKRAHQIIKENSLSGFSWVEVLSSVAWFVQSHYSLWVFRQMLGVHGNVPAGLSMHERYSGIRQDVKLFWNNYICAYSGITHRQKIICLHSSATTWEWQMHLKKFRIGICISQQKGHIGNEYCRVIIVSLN